VKDKDIFAVTVLAEVEGDKEHWRRVGCHLNFIDS